MIVGGDEAVRVLELLASDGYVTVHSTPGKMVAELARLKPKVLLFELALESKGVEDLIQRIQATAYGAVVPIVFFGPPPGPNPAEVVVLGGDLYLPTPVDPAELKACVKRLAGGPPAALEPELEPGRSFAFEGSEEPSAGLPTEVEPGAGSHPPSGHGDPAPGHGDPAPGHGDPSPRPEPSEPEQLETPGRPAPIDLPWNDLAERRPPKAPHDPMDDQGADLLERAMEEDLFLDPREMALTITTMVPEMSAAEDLQPPRGSPGDARRDQDAGPDPLTMSGDPSEVEAIVQELMGPGGEGDTVAVRIRRTIDAFEERFIAPGIENGGSGRHGPSPSQQASSTLPGAPALPEEDGIDLDALDHVDDSEGDYTEDPERVLQQLEDDLSTGDASSATATPPPVSPGGTEVSRENSLPPEPTGEDLRARGSPDGDDSPSFTPAPSDAYMEARDVPAPQGAAGSRSAPIASPYDLPPVVSDQGFEHDLATHGPGDVVDTVLGRRTAVHINPSGGEGALLPSAGQGAAGDTQPAKRAASARGPLPRHPSPSPERLQLDSEPGPAPQDHEPPAPSTRLQYEGAGDVPPDGARPAPEDLLPRDPPDELRQGSLQEMDPATLIQAMASLELSGALEISHPEGRYELHLHRGRLRLAQSSRIEESMLEMLRRQGRISDDQRRQVAQELTSGRRAGAVLLDRGWIKPAELIPTVRQHLEDLVYAIFALEDGTFRFDASRPLPEEIVYLERPTAALVLEGVRRKYTVARIQRLVGSSQIAPVKLPAADESILAGSNLSGRDWRLMDAMDGRRTVDQISTELGVAPQDLWTLAWGLASLGLVKLHRPGAEVEPRATERLPSPPGNLEPGAMEPGAAEGPPRDLDLDVERVLSRHRLVREGDYFACLGVAPQASPHELRRAYDQTLSLFDPHRLHPAVRTRYAQELEEILEVVHEAFSVLSDEPLRDAYRARVTTTSSSGEDQ